MKLVVLLLASTVYQVHTSFYYYTKPGFFTSTSCAVAVCPTCQSGEFMQGCAGYPSAVINGPPPGYCTACTAVANSHFTSDGGVTDSCASACNDGFFSSGGNTCMPNVSGNVYVVQFQVAVILPPASTFNIRKYIISMISLAGVSGCASTPTQVIPNRLYETACTSSLIRVTVDTNGLVSTSSYMDRRLLAASGTADVGTEIQIQSDPVKATQVQQSISVSAVNTLLTANSVGTTTSVSAPTVVIITATTSTFKSSSNLLTTAPALLITQGLTTVTSRLTTPPPTPDAGSTNIAVYVAVGAGAVVVLGGIITAFVCLGSKSNSSKQAPRILKIPLNKAQPPIVVPIPPSIVVPIPIVVPAPPVAAQFNIRRMQSMYSVPQLYPVYPLHYIQPKFQRVRKFEYN